MEGLLVEMDADRFLNLGSCNLSPSLKNLDLIKMIHVVTVTYQYERSLLICKHAIWIPCGPSGIICYPE